MRVVQHNRQRRATTLHNRADNEAGVGLLDGPGRREVAFGLVGHRTIADPRLQAAQAQAAAVLGATLQQLGQLGDVRADAAGLVAGEQLGRCPIEGSAGLQRSQSGSAVPHLKLRQSHLFHERHFSNVRR
jgi:hypothetical protein